MNPETEPRPVNRIDQSSQALELRPWVWIVLGLAAILGVARWIGDRDELQTLVYLEKENPVIVRAASGTHVFPRLGIQVALAQGWSYLSVTDDVAAVQATFVNESADSIISLRRFLFRSWPPIESKVLTTPYRNVAIEWVKVDHRVVGRLTEEHVDVIVMVMTHSANAELNRAVEDFCNGIQLIAARE